MLKQTIAGLHTSNGALPVYGSPNRGALTPLALWTSTPGVAGAWYDPTDLTSMFQDTAGTIAAVVGSPVKRINDKSGNGNNAVTSGIGPTVASFRGVPYLIFDGAVATAIGASFAMSTPISRVSGIQQNSWAYNKAIFADPTSLVNTFLVQFGSSPFIDMYDGSHLSSLSQLPLGQRGVVNQCFNGASSSMTVNSLQPLTGNAGSNAASGLLIGGYALGSAGANFAWWGTATIARVLTANENAMLLQYYSGAMGMNP